MYIIFSNIIHKILFIIYLYIMKGGKICLAGLGNTRLLWRIQVFMKQDIATYPVVLTEYNDESGHYYVVTSPNIQGMVTDGETIPEALENAKDALATMLANELERPEVQDPREWTLDKGQQTSWVSVNMTR